MPRFAFQARSNRGAEISGAIEAADRESAQAQLRQRGYFVTNLQEIPPWREVGAVSATAREDTTNCPSAVADWFKATLLMAFVGAVLGFGCGVFMAVNAALISELVFGHDIGDLSWCLYFPLGGAILLGLLPTFGLLWETLGPPRQKQRHKVVTKHDPNHGEDTSGQFVTKATEVANSTDQATDADFSAAKSVVRGKHDAEDEQSFVDEPPPGNRLQCRLTDKQLVLYMLPSSSMSVGFLGRFPVVFLGVIVLVTLSGICVGLEGEDYRFVIPLLILFWLAGLVLFYCWLRGRFGKTRVLIEPGRLVRKLELFGREKVREYVLDENNRASLVADFHVGGDDSHLGSPVYHVHVTTTGRSAKFGTFLSRKEKNWIVARINRHLDDPG